MQAARFDRLVRRAVSLDRRSMVGLLGGGLLAALPTGRSAVAAPRPACVPDCSGKDCGDDGCGGSCGSCPGTTTCGGGGVTGQCGGGADCHGRQAKAKAAKRAKRCRNLWTLRCLLRFANDLAEAAICSNDFDNCCALYAECQPQEAGNCTLVVALEYGF